MCDLNMPLYLYYDIGNCSMSSILFTSSVKHTFHEFTDISEVLQCLSSMKMAWYIDFTIVVFPLLALFAITPLVLQGIDDSLFSACFSLHSV